MLLLHLISHQFFLFILLFLQSFLFKNHLSLYFSIFKIFLSLQFPKFFCQMIKKCSNIFIRPQLPPICDHHPTKWTFFFTLAIIRFNTIGTKSMNTLFILNRIVHHFLTNWTCQCFLHSTYKILSNHIMQSYILVTIIFSIKSLISLIRFMINDFFCLLFIFPITKFEFQTFLFKSF